MVTDVEKEQVLAAHKISFDKFRFKFVIQANLGNPYTAAVPYPEVPLVIVPHKF